MSRNRKAIAAPIAAPALPPLSDFAHLDFAEVSEHDADVVTFWRSCYGYCSRRQELEHESNADFVLVALLKADDGVGYVDDRGPLVKVSIRNRRGEYTAAYRELIAQLEQLSDYPILDDADYQGRLETAADDDADYWLDDAAAIIDGGEQALKAHYLGDYVGEWADLQANVSDESRDYAIADLASRLSYAAIDND